MRWVLLLAISTLACSRATAPASTLAADASSGATPPAALPGTTVRAALDRIGDCIAAPAVPVRDDRAWSRNGGLLHRTFLRGRTGADLSLSLVFPSGPDGPIDVTGGYAHVSVDQASIRVELVVAVSATGTTERSYLSVTGDSVELAQLPYAQPMFATIASPTTLEPALDAAIERRHTLTPAQLATKNVCVVLPPARPGIPGRGQECHDEPTTATDRTNALAEAKAATAREEATVKTNLTVLSAMVAETYLYADPTCAARLAP